MITPAKLFRFIRRHMLAAREDGIIAGCRYLVNELTFRGRKAMLRQQLMVKKLENFSMYLDLGDPGLSHTLAVYGKRELDQIYILRNELTPGMTVMDIGANLGFYALLESHLIGKHGRVYALEPSARNFHILEKNIKLNHSESVIEPYQLGASNTSGAELFYLQNMSNLHTFLPTTYRHYAAASQSKARSVEVQTITVTDFIPTRRPPDRIRMDIEGYEVEVLDGMSGALANGFSPLILFECHFPKYDNIHYNMRKQIERLFSYGYYPKVMVSNGESEQGFNNLGYTQKFMIRTEGKNRYFYKGVTPTDSATLICDIGFVRAVLMAPSNTNSNVYF